MDNWYNKDTNTVIKDHNTDAQKCLIAEELLNKNISLKYDLQRSNKLRCSYQNPVIAQVYNVPKSSG
jgi:hypothetical protein